VGTLGGPDGRVVWFELTSALADAGRITIQRFQRWI
jgi:hypothetical protein